MAKYKKRPDGRYYTTIATDEINPNTGEKVRIPVYGRTIAEFEDNKAAVRDAINKGTYTNDKGITFSEYKWIWFDTYKANRAYNTRASYQNILKNHTATLDNLSLSKIKKSDVQLGYNKLKGHSDLQSLYKQTVNQILKCAIDDGYIYKNVADNIETDRVKKKKKRALTKIERVSIQKADFTLREKCFEAILHYAGLRRQEIAALTQFDIDLKEKIIHINKAIEWIGEKPNLKDTKSEAGERNIPILEPLYPILKEYLSTLDTTILFPNTSGKYLTKTQYRRIFETIKRKINSAAGGTHEWKDGKLVYTIDLCKGLTSHVFRREFATILYYSGVDLLDAIRIFGHADVKEMLEIYAELRVEESSSASKINSYLRIYKNVM